jgi:hypothetical protein
MGWILVKNYGRVPATAPAQSRSVFSKLLGQLLAPYGRRPEGGGVHFSESTIAEFYKEVIRQVGAGVLPEGYRP